MIPHATSAACLLLVVVATADAVAGQTATRAPVLDALEAGELRVRMLSRTYQELQESLAASWVGASRIPSP
jgi:hypothetical protein